MNDPIDIRPQRPHVPDVNPWISSLITLLVILAGFILIGPVIGIFIAIPFYEGSAMDFLQQATNPVAPEGLRVPLLILQGCVTTIGLGIVPAFYWWRATRVNPMTLVSKPISLQSVVFSALAMICFLGPVSLFIYWNADVDLPDGWFENWARTTEDRATALTKYMTSFESPGEFILGLVVIAILPSMFEELAFRGLLQPELHRASGNIHVAIWLSSILFSALHLQFFGFVPRVLLGAMFGYLYFWSGNLLVPMIAHVVNNGLQVILIYVGQKEIAGMDLENPAMPPLGAVAAMSVLTVGFIYLFRRTLPPKTDPA
jgi:membrane protease YdiL (CAAX protease family)